jgi:hypothetical protein
MGHLNKQPDDGDVKHVWSHRGRGKWLHRLIGRDPFGSEAAGERLVLRRRQLGELR